MHIESTYREYFESVMQSCRVQKLELYFVLLAIFASIQQHCLSFNQDGYCQVFLVLSSIASRGGWQDGGAGRLNLNNHPLPSAMGGLLCPALLNKSTKSRHNIIFPQKYSILSRFKLFPARCWAGKKLSRFLFDAK